MAFAKRIMLYLGLNILIVTTISVLLSIFHVQPYLNQYGLDLPQLAIYCLIWGMGSALISLGLSRATAKWFYGVKLIDTSKCSDRERWMVQTVQSLVRKAGLNAMPEIGMYQSDEANAFATGPSKSRALIAVSSGLLNMMNNEEVEGVLGHEISHIVNGDMVTMTLLQGVVNAFALFIARAITFVIMRGSKDRGFTGLIIMYALQSVLLILGAVLVATYSRKRECSADDGGVRLAGREPMIKALEALQRTYDRVDPRAQPALQTMKISSQPRGIWKLFSTHPPLEERIARLKAR